MPLPPVVIEISTADAGSPHAAAMVASCTQAVTDGECQTGASDESNARAIAIVSWGSGRSQVSIELGVKRAGKTRWASRRIEFKQTDPEAERWRAVGLVVGTLVGETEREVEPASSPAQPDPAAEPPAPTPGGRQVVARPPPPSPSRSSTSPPRLWVGLDGVLGPALDDGSWRFGAELLAVYDTPLAPLLAVSTLRYVGRAADDRQVAARWLGLTFGVGLHHEPMPSLRLEARGEALLERMETSVAGARRDDASRWYPGARLTLAGGVLVGDRVAFVFAGEFTGLGQGTVVTLRNEAVGRAPPLTWGLTLGARLGVF